tara:strand:- start:3523 stop:7164 length:3642 start_codon:yes stop_codon:yes gene_type:complete
MKKLLNILISLLWFSSSAQITGDSTIVPNISTIDSIVYNYVGVCQNQSTGIISINTYPTSNSYYYDWVGQGVITAVVDVDSLDAGTYTFDIYNDINLTSWLYRINIEIEEPQQISTFLDITHPTCHDYNDGEINILNTLGDGPFSYVWEDTVGDIISSTIPFQNLVSSTYILATEDTYGCIERDTLILNNPLELITTANNNIVSCIDSCNSESSVSVASGGVTPFTYQWNDPITQTTETAYNLCYGVYEIITTDNNACKDTVTITIENPDTLKIESLTINEACFNICDGEIQANITGGIQPYSYEWENTNGILSNTTSNINNLCPDTYVFTFTDANDCIKSETIQLNEQDSFIVNNYITPISCNSYCDGEIGIHFINQINTPISYFWSNGSQDTLASGLCSDSIQLIITDADNCLDTFSFYLNNPDSISIQIVNLVDSLNCFADSNGLISLSTLGGNAPYEYLWTDNGNIFDTTSTISSLTANQYDLKIIDNNECEFDTIFTIYEPTQIENTFSVDEPTCYGFFNGSIESLITGGVGNYTYQWNTHINDTLEILDSISANTYYLTVIDSNGCILEDTVFVNEPSEIIVNTLMTNALCYGGTGAISVNPTGGTPPYNYNYFGQDPLQLLADTNYQFVLNDLNGCSSDTIIYSVSQPPPITNLFTITDASCFGHSDGSASIITSGGTPSYLHNWNGEDPNNLFEGTYIVSTTDENNCTVFDTISINEPSEIIITPFLIEPSCYGYSDGVINALATGGDGGPYTYFPDLSTLSNLSSGTYTLISEDANGCASNPLEITLGEPNELIATINSYSNISCYNASDGSIDLNITGGSLPYSFNWSSTNEYTNNNQNINSLTTGTYYVSISDINNCSTSLQQELTQPSAIASNFNITSLFNGYNVSCHNECDGEIETTNSGGTPPYSITWSNGMNGITVSNVCAGILNYTLTDINNCEYTSGDIQLIEPEEIIANISLIDNASCFGNCDGSAEVNNITGGIPPYNISWIQSSEENELASELCAESNYVEIEDQNNCIETLSINIDSPSEIIAEFQISPENGQAPLLTSITNYSLEADIFSWSISNLFSDSIINTDFQTIIDVFGEYEITLVAMNSNTNCSEEYTQVITVEGLIELPNAISPNGDNINDYLSFESYGIEDFSINIFNRWGTKVYTLTDVNQKWNGNSIYGEALPEGVYFYILTAEGIEGSLIEQKGSITLYR